MSDLVSRLLAKIESVEEAASEAVASCGRVGGAGRWLAQSMRTATVGSRTHEVWSLAQTPVADGLRPSVAAFFEASDPESVLRLCQAHRQIIETYQRVIRDKKETVGEIVQVRPGTAWDERLAMLAHSANAFEGVLLALAGGYGIQEGDGDG